MLSLTPGESTRHDRNMTNDSKIARGLADKFAEYQCRGREIRTELMHTSIAKYVWAHPDFKTDLKAAIADAQATYNVSERMVWVALCRTAAD